MSKLIESRHYRFRQLASGVLAAIAIDGGGAFANSGIVDLGDKTIVYDTSITPAAAVDLVRAAQSLTGRSTIDYVVNSHYHKDHVRGNTVFSPDTHIVGTRTTRDLLIARGKQQIKRDADTIYGAIQRTDRKIVEAYDRLSKSQQKDLQFAAGWQRAVYESLHKLRLRYPDITFDRRIVINGSKRRAVLVNLEDAHTPSDVVLFLPEDHAAFVGDLSMPRRHRWLGESSIAAYEEAVSFLKALGLVQIVPGHGDVPRNPDLDHELQYAIDVTAMVRTAVDNGATRAEVAALPCPHTYAEWRFHDMLYPLNLDALYDRFCPEAGQEHPPAEDDTLRLGSPVAHHQHDDTTQD